MQKSKGENKHSSLFKRTSTIMSCRQPFRRAIIKECIKVIVQNLNGSNVSAKNGFDNFYQTYKHTLNLSLAYCTLGTTLICNNLHRDVGHFSVIN